MGLGSRGLGFRVCPCARWSPSTTEGPKTGEVRSTLNDQLMEKAADVRASTLDLKKALLEKVKSLDKSGNPASRQELMAAMLRYFCLLESMKYRL